jgi:pyruvate-formate lyase-activating enzyme
MTIPYSNKFDKITDRQNWADDNQHICLLPYTSLQYFQLLKSASPCCNLEQTNEDDFSKPINEFKKIIQSGKDNSDNFLKPIYELKQAIESGNTYNNCKTCYQCESEGKISERTRYLIGLDDQQIDSFLENQTINEDFYIHCTLSNLCNMACRSCNSYTSSLFSKVDHGHELALGTMSDHSNHWNSLLDSIIRETSTQKNVILVVSGGEGSIQPDFYKLVDWLIANNISKKIQLTINTNGSIDDELLYQNLCNNFKKVSLSISIDSINENYHYVRWPCTWSKINKNLNSFVSYKKQFKNFNFFLTPVWSINNIFYLTDWVEFFESFNNNNDLYLDAYDTPLYQPDWLDVQNLPAYIKNILVEKISPVLLNPWLIRNKTFHANITNLIKLCATSTNAQSDMAWHEYLRNTAKWDVRTNTELSIHNKLMYEIMNAEDTTLFLELKQKAAMNYKFVN